MKHLVALLLVIGNLASAQSLNVPLPPGCVPTIEGSTVVCGGTPPPMCPPGDTGTPPNCVPPSGWNGKCAGYSSTVVIPMQWSASALYYSSGFAPDGALVAYFDTPAALPSPAPTSGKGSIAAVQYGGRIEPRSGSLSASPCDFTGGIGGTNVFISQPGPTVYFTFGYTKSGIPDLQPGTRYYLNIHNDAGCANGSCDMRLTFSKPSGT